MRAILLFFLLLLVLPGLAQNDGVAYLDIIGNEFDNVSKELMSYTSAAAHARSAKKIEKRRQDLLVAVQQAERNVRKMKPFNGETAFRDTVVSYFDISYHVLNEDYGKIVDMEEVAEQSYDAMEAYLLAKERASEKLAGAFDRVENQRQLFASKNNIRLIQSTSKVSEKLKASGKVYDYYNKIYLIFFKSFKDEAYLMAALQANDLGAKEQTKNALLKSSTEGLNKTGPIGTFNGDGSLKASCQALLNFYKQEAAGYVDQVIDFDLKKDNFEKIKKAFDNKKPSERTKQDIEVYNKSVNEFNLLINQINKIHHEQNNKRNQLLDQWNKVSNQFLDRHVPKYNG